MKSWIVNEIIPEDVSTALSSYPPLLQILLFNRGIKTAKDADVFLTPDYDRDLFDPFLILNMDKAVDRILTAIRENEKFAIYADYDADGIPGSVVLYDLFNKIGHKNFEVYIPHRYKEGYGLNTDAIDSLAKAGVTLIITVDSGITDVDEVAHANKLGIDVIISDHHLPQDVLPEAFAILNPNQENCSYPYSDLCGGGVAFKLAQAILLKGDFDIEKGWEKWLLDVAGISTISDMVPLTGENRAIATFGLKVLQKTQRPGLLDLYRKRRVGPNLVSEDDVGYVIAPRINAASRLDVPMNAFHFLSTRDEVIAKEIGKRLEKKNDERKVAVSDIMYDIENNSSIDTEQGVVVVGNSDWMPGILGLCATRLVELYKKPAFVWGANGSDFAIGSCRSDGSVNMVDLMSAVEKGLFIDHGGHEMSGGFKLDQANTNKLEERILDAYRDMAKNDKEEESLTIDRKIDLDSVNWDVYSLINKMSPFGMANERPLFLFESVEIESISYFGKDGAHLKIQFKRPDKRPIEGISFFKRVEIDERSLKEGKIVDVVAHIEKDTFGKFPKLRLRMEAIKSSL